MLEWRWSHPREGGASQHGLLLLGWEADARGRRTRSTWGTRGGSRPHVNGPSPRVQEGGPWRAVVATSTALAALTALVAWAAQATPPAVTAAATSGGASPGKEGPWGGRGVAAPGGGSAAATLLDGDVKKAEGGGVDCAMLSSAKRRSLRTSVKEGEWPLASDELGHELEVLIEASQNIQHKGAVGDRFAKSSKSISFVLHRAAVVVDGESAL